MKKVLLFFVLTVFPFFAYADFFTGENYYNDRKYQDAFNELLPIAEAGDFRAKYYVGHMYLYGYGVGKDEKKGLEFIQSSADGGYDKAQALLGYLYDVGKFIPQNKGKAIDLFTAAANQNNSDAILSLGFLYYKGEGVEKDNKKAIEMFERVPTDHEHIYTGRYLGEAYMNSDLENKLEKAEKEFRKSALMDDVESFYKLGQLYESEGNKKCAGRYYEYAASKGHIQSQYLLGTMYVNGENVSKDKFLGYAWLKLAANNQYEPAVSALARLDADMSLQEREQGLKELIRLHREVLEKIESPIEVEEREKYKHHTIAYKPIIYLYPEEITNVTVELGYPQNITHTYPKYGESWQLQAEPSGDLTDLKTGRHYYALYWEGKNTVPDKKQTDGFIVKGENIINFLEEKLDLLGLTEREAEEFIVYWLPKLENNPYNFIRFQTLAEQNENMPLIIKPVPKTLIRVMMEYDNLDKMIKIKEQILPPKPKRDGFTVVEWGGTKIDIK